MEFKSQEEEYKFYCKELEKIIKNRPKEYYLEHMEYNREKSLKYYHEHKEYYKQKSKERKEKLKQLKI